MQVSKYNDSYQSIFKFYHDPETHVVGVVTTPEVILAFTILGSVFIASATMGCYKFGKWMNTPKPPQKSQEDKDFDTAIKILNIAPQIFIGLLSLKRALGY